jgi:NAD(P)-dependent dehydrogenase (short-subunit alcohol dehydrogenase family)
MTLGHAAAGTLRERRVVVTGVAGGIGSAIRHRTEQLGATVFGTDIIGGPDVVRCDVSSEADVIAAFDRAASAGAITDVVHASGICTTSPVASMRLDDWQRVLAVNLTGAFLVGREAARRLPDGGNLIFIASVAGLTGDPFFGAYCASKFGVVALTQVMARELGHRRIRVNAVCPAGVRTAMSDETIRVDAMRLGRSEAELRQLYEADSFAGRWAAPEEVADAVAYLMSDGASYISGHSLVLNGGGNLSSHR